MSAEQKLLDLKRRFNKAAIEEAEREGALGQLNKRLKQETGCDSQEDGERKLRVLKKEDAKLTEDIEEGIEDIEEKLEEASSV